MRRLILLLLLIVVAGCGGGGSLAAPSGAVMTITPASKEGAPIKVTSSSALQKSIVQLYQLSVKDSAAAGAKGVRDTIFDVTFELSNVPGTGTADLTSLVTMCDGSAIINTTAEKQTDNQGIYNLCIVFKVGGGLNYTGNLRVLSGASSASTTIDVASTLPELTLSPDLIIPPGSRGQFTITGGSPEYTITSSSVSILPVPSVVTSSGGTFMVTIPPGATETPIVFTVRDAAGKTVKATVTVGAPASPTVLPAAATVVAGGTAKFMIVGGVPNYTVTSSLASIVAVPETVTVNGGIFTVTVPVNTTATSATLNVRDSLGGNKDVLITILAPSKPVITPSSLSMTAGNTATFAISGGVPGYTVVSNNPVATPSPAQVVASGDTFQVITSPTLPATSGITITALDSIGQSVSASISITALPLQLTITPNAVTVVPSTQQSLNFSISGGTGPYSITSSNPTDVYFGTAGNGTTTGASATATVRAGAATGTVTIRVTDSVNAQRTASITILPVPPVQIVPNAVTVVPSTQQSLNFTISGGIGPYSVTSSNPSDIYFGIAGNGTATGAAVTATVRAGAAAGTVTIRVTDSVNAQSTATVTISAVPQIQIVPNAVSVLSAAPDDIIPFTISGGVAPYAVTSSNPAAAYLGTVAGTSIVTISTAPLSFTATVPAGAVVGAVTITVQDSLGNSKTVTITIQ